MGSNLPFAMVHDFIGCSELKGHQNADYKVLCEVHTLPEAASRSFTGHSRTDTKKQYKAGLAALAPGYHAKSRTGDGCWNTGLGSSQCSYQSTIHASKTR